MAAVFQTIFSNTFSCMKMHEFRLRFHWSLFPRVQLTKSRHSWHQERTRKTVFESVKNPMFSFTYYYAGSFLISDGPIWSAFPDDSIQTNKRQCDVDCYYFMKTNPPTTKSYKRGCLLPDYSLRLFVQHLYMLYVNVDVQILGIWVFSTGCG